MAFVQDDILEENQEVIRNAQQRYTKFIRETVLTVERIKLLKKYRRF